MKKRQRAKLSQHCSAGRHTMCRSRYCQCFCLYHHGTFEKADAMTMADLDKRVDRILARAKKK